MTNTNDPVKPKLPVFTPKPRRRRPKEFHYLIRETSTEHRNPNVQYNYDVVKLGVFDGEVDEKVLSQYHVYGNNDGEVPLLCDCPSSLYGQHPGSNECKHVPWTREVIEANESGVVTEGAYYDTESERVVFPKS